MKNFNLLLESDTVIILGAGASKDYRFPLWDELKDELMKYLKNHKSFLFRDHLMDNYWFNELENLKNKNKTLDQMVYDSNDRDKSDYIMKLVTLIIVNFEILDLDRNKKNWIEELSEMYYLNVPKSGFNLFPKNINIITYNYDRCFEHHFTNNYMKKSYELLDTQPHYTDKLRYYQKTSSLKIFHPHGCIGVIPQEEDKNHLQVSIDGYTIRNTNTNRLFKYGDNNIFIDAHNYLQITAVDECNKSDGTYSICRNLIENCKKIIVVGVSAMGLNNQKLEFGHQHSFEIFSGASFNENDLDQVKFKNVEIINHKLRTDGFINWLNEDIS